MSNGDEFMAEMAAFLRPGAISDEKRDVTALKLKKSKKEKKSKKDKKEKKLKKSKRNKSDDEAGEWVQAEEKKTTTERRGNLKFLVLWSKVHFSIQVLYAYCTCIS